jgi:hypothetical protein
LKRGVAYAYLNLDIIGQDTSISADIDFIRELSEVACPKYIFLLGNEKVVDVVAWENLCKDSDEDVESDLPYASLNMASPWDGGEYDFGPAIRVGRLPTYDGEAFAAFASYFLNVMQRVDSIGRLVPYGLSAMVWEDESNHEYGSIAGENKCVDTVPDIKPDEAESRIGETANLLFFNLHGSDETEFWYGQAGNSYPVAFSPQNLTGRSSPYFIGVEACYGARYTGGLDADNSILVSAMQNNCLAFLGSSRIAYGKPCPQGSCADILVGEFLRQLAAGETAGDAYMAGVELLAEQDELDDAEVKTLAEFALYGDPSVCAGSCGARTKSIAKPLHSRMQDFHIPMPDVRRAVSLAITEIDAKIEKAIDEYAAANLLPELLEVPKDSIKQHIYRFADKDRYVKVYSLGNGVIDRSARVYFDGKGTIRKGLVSK